MIGPGLNLLSGGLLPDTRRLIDAMTVRPVAARIRRIDRTIRSLNRENIWPVIDGFYRIAAHDEQAARLDWKNPGTNTLVYTGTPPISSQFTVDRGVTGNATDVRLDATISGTPANYTSMSAHIAAIVLTNTATAVDDCSLRTSGAVIRGAVRIRNGATASSIRASTNGGLSSSTAINVPKMVLGDRLDGSNQTIYQRGVADGTGAAAGAAIGANGLIQILWDGTSYNDRQFAFLCYGGGLGDAKAAAFTKIMTADFADLGVAI